jgi:hypothetical protein
MELEALCKRLREDTHKLKEEKTTLEGMIQSRDDLIMEMAEEYVLNCIGENDDADEGNATATPMPAPPTVVPEDIVKVVAPVETVPEKEASVAHEVILADAELERLQPRLFNMIMSLYEESPPRMVNGPHELDDLDDLDA